jgi:curved DNA-binding protein CbpA
MGSYYDRLGVSPAATAGEIRQAYLRLAREKHPDRFTDPAQKQSAQAEFQEITTAFNTLSNPRSRQEYDAELQRPPAPRTPEEQGKDAYARAQPLLRAGHYEEAVALLRAAVHHLPGEASCHAALGHALSHLPGGARDAIQALERATQIDPRDAAAFADLAWVLADQGLRLRAQKALAAAQRLAPRDPRIARLAAELERS